MESVDDIATKISGDENRTEQKSSDKDKQDQNDDLASLRRFTGTPFSTTPSAIQSEDSVHSLQLPLKVNEQSKSSK